MDDARKEFSTRATLKSTTAAVAVSGILTLGSPTAPEEPQHADDHRPFIGLPTDFGFAGGTAIHPEGIRESTYVAGSAVPGPGAHFKIRPEPFAGI
jgi:hypothetical protein